jgi:hypothetical protein
VLFREFRGQPKRIFRENKPRGPDFSDLVDHDDAKYEALRTMESDITMFSTTFSSLIDAIWTKMIARKDRFCSTTMDYSSRKTWNAHNEYKSLVYAFFLFSRHMLQFHDQMDYETMSLPEFAHCLADEITSFRLEQSDECPPCMQAKLIRIQNDLAEMVRQGDVEVLKNADVEMYI